MLWCCVFTEMETMRISILTLCLFELFLERKKHVAIVCGLLSVQLRGHGISGKELACILAPLAWVSEHGILLEKSCSRLHRNTKQIQLYETEIAALY